MYPKPYSIYLRGPYSLERIQHDVPGLRAFTEAGCKLFKLHCGEGLRGDFRSAR